MAAPLESVVKQLEESGIIAAGKLSDFVPPKAAPRDVDELVEELVKHDHLTKFQAQQVKAGKAKALILGGYTILDKIGAGGMGQVFKAQHRRMKRIVAIKMLPPAMMKDAAAAARFQREVEAAAKLLHPNIVSAFDADQANGVHFLVMEYVEGSDLSQIVKARGPLPVNEAVGYIRQAAAGLAYAHGEGIVHRDIKPANLLVDKKGTVKILDMGLARIEEVGSADDHQLTNTGAVMGTVDYMAPEQAADTRHADAKSDVYSLGCSLFRLLTGDNAYQGDTVVKKILAHMHDPIPSLCARRPDVPQTIDALFQQMMAKRGDARPTMAQVVEMIDAWNGPASMSTSSASLASSDSHLTQFLQGLNTGTSTGASITGPSVGEEGMTAALGNQRLKSIAAPERTQSFSTPDIDTDPTSQVLIPSKPAPAIKRGGKGLPSKRGLWLAAGAAGFVFLALGVVIVLKNDRGEVVGQLEVPANTTVTIQKDGQTVVTVPATGKPVVETPKPVKPVATSTASATPLVAANYELDLSGKLPDGTFARIRLPERAPGDVITVEMFARPRSIANGTHALFSAFPLGLRQNGNQWQWYVDRAFGERRPAAVSSKAAIEVGRRVHLAGVLKDRSLSLYIDGQLAGTTTFSNLVTSSTKYFVLGRSGYAPDNAEWTPFDGTIDEVRITDGVRYDKSFRPSERLQREANTWALYHCDEGTGNVLVDASGNKRDGEVFGATWVRADSVPVLAHPPIAANYELDLSGNLQDGKFARVELPKRPMTSSLTVEMFATPRSEPQQAQAISALLLFYPIGLKRSGPLWHWYVDRGDGKSDGVSSPVVFNQRIHLAAVLDTKSKQLHLYVDGRSAGTKAFETDLPKGDKLFTLGRSTSNDGSWAPFDGTIDEVRITDAVRYTQDFNPTERLEPDNKTWALYHCDEGQGDVLVDVSGKNNHGKIVGAKWVVASASPTPSPQSPAPLTQTEILASPDYVWSEPENLGPNVNSIRSEFAPAVSGDGLTLVFTSQRGGGRGMNDLWMCERKNLGELFGPAVNLGPPINTSEAESYPWLSADGLTLLYCTKLPEGAAPAGMGLDDLYLATRSSRGEPFGNPTPLAKPINTGSSEQGAAMTADQLTIVFSRATRLDSFGGFDLWQSRRKDRQSPFDKPVNLGPTVNTTDDERVPWLSADGRVVLFGIRKSTADGEGKQKSLEGAGDVWMAIRPSLDAPFGARQLVGPPISNPDSDENHVSITADGKLMIFASIRAGGLGESDLWQSSRVPNQQAALSQTEILISPDYVWTEPEKVGSGKNSPYVSGDGLTVGFISKGNKDKVVGKGGNDVWISERKSLDDPFGKAMSIGPTINSSIEETSPWMSADGLTLLFSSNREGGKGYNDLWLATRRSRNEVFGAPTPLGEPVNAPSSEFAGAFTADGLTIIIASARKGSAGSVDLWQSRRKDLKSPFDEPQNLGPTVNSKSEELRPWLSADGRVLLFSTVDQTKESGGKSKRIAGTGKLWMAVRPSIDAPFGERQEFGPPISAPGADNGFPSVTADGKLLFFNSRRKPDDPDYDVWMSRRVPKADAAPGDKHAASPFDVLKQEDIPADALKEAGLGDPAKAPAEIVRILGRAGDNWAAFPKLVVRRDGRANNAYVADWGRKGGRVR